MNPRLFALALERQRLVARSGELRGRLEDHAAGLAPLFAVGDALASGVAFVRRHPDWIAGAAVVLLVAKPRVAWRWARRALVGWRVWRTVREFLDRAPPPRRRAT